MLNFDANVSLSGSLALQPGTGGVSGKFPSEKNASREPAWRQQAWQREMERAQAANVLGSIAMAAPDGARGNAGPPQVSSSLSGSGLDAARPWGRSDISANLDSRHSREGGNPPLGDHSGPMDSRLRGNDDSSHSDLELAPMGRSDATASRRQPDAEGRPAGNAVVSEGGSRPAFSSVFHRAAARPATHEAGWRDALPPQACPERAEAAGRGRKPSETRGGSILVAHGAHAPPAPHETGAAQARAPAKPTLPDRWARPLEREAPPTLRGRTASSETAAEAPSRHARAGGNDDGASLTAISSWPGHRPDRLADAMGQPAAAPSVPETAHRIGDSRRRAETASRLALDVKSPSTRNVIVSKDDGRPVSRSRFRLRSDELAGALAAPAAAVLETVYRIGDSHEHTESTLQTVQTPAMAVQPAARSSATGRHHVPASASVAPEALIRIHMERHEPGQIVWVAMRDDDEVLLQALSRIISGLGEELAVLGQRLHRVVCNGRRVWSDDAPGPGSPEADGWAILPGASGGDPRIHQSVPVDKET